MIAIVRHLQQQQIEAHKETMHLLQTDEKSQHFFSIVQPLD